TCVLLKAREVTANVLEGVDGLLAVEDGQARLGTEVSILHEVFEHITFVLSYFDLTEDNECLLVVRSGFVVLAAVPANAAQVIESSAFTATVFDFTLDY